MSRRRIATPALLRGAAIGTSTALLAVTAHAVAGGGSPSGVVNVQLALLALTVGAFSAVLRDGHRLPVLVAVLAVGQTLGHVLLAAGGHHHVSASTSAVPMLSGHVVAVLAIAALVAVGETLCRAVSRAVRSVTPPAIFVVPAAPAQAVRRGEHPSRTSLLLAASLSYRGPPVSLAR